MNITIDQIIETLKDENKRKQIEEIICGNKPKEFEEDIYIRSNYYIAYNSCVEADSQKEYSLKDSEHYNHFENEKDAIMIAKKQDAEKKLYHIAKHLNKGWMPDWNNFQQEKWKLNYDHARKEYICFDRSAVDDAVVHFKSKNMLLDIIRLMGKQSLKDYFMIED